MAALRNFLYLDAPKVASLISGLEPGLRTAFEERRTAERSGGGEAGIAGLAVKGERGSSDESMAQYTDTPEAQFRRLLEALEQAGEVSQLIDPSDQELAKLRTGALVELVDWDVFIPQASRLLTRAGGVTDALDALEAMRPMAEMLGLSMEGVPAKSEVGAIRGTMSQMATDEVVLVGELEGAETRVSGRLKQEWLRGDVEDLTTIVGTVSGRLKSGSWRPLVALPGAGLLSREQRRQAERTRPPADQIDSFLEGPAVLLDVLAIYR